MKLTFANKQVLVLGLGDTGLSALRWLHARDDSPWYPTMRLFRQQTPGDWASVIARVADELRGTVPGSR